MDHLVGTVEPGKKADFVIIDEDYHILKVLLGGNTVVDNTRG
jgi:N-acetylglucosamine-6-phosphate deacetylase